MVRRRPPVEMPKVTKRSSSNEWSGSAPVADRTSRNTVAASSNETPCLARFSAALPGSHSKRNHDPLTWSAAQRRGPLHRNVGRLKRSIVAPRAHTIAETRPSVSLDDLIRPQQQRLRDRQAERLGGLEVDHELPLRRLLDGEIGGLGALQDLVHEGGSSAEHIREVSRIGHEAASLSVLSLREHAGQSVLQREVR